MKLQPTTQILLPNPPLHDGGPLISSSGAHPQAQRARITRPGEGEGKGEGFAWGGQRIETLLTSAQTNGLFGLSLVEASENVGPPLHVHEREDEIFTVLQGRFEFQIRSECLEATRGDVVFAPRGVAHTFRSLENGSRMAVAFSPGGFEGYLAACEPLFATGAPDITEMARLNAEFGVAFLDSPDQEHENASQTALEPLVVRFDEGVLVGPPGERARCVLTSQASGGILLAEVEVDPGAGPPPHVHTDEDEIFFISEGRFELWTGEARCEVGPGTLIYGPRDVPHAWRALGDTPAKVWVYILPGQNFEAFFGAYGEMMQAESPDFEAIARFAGEHGIVVLGPPESAWL